MLYRSTRRARLTPLAVLSNIRQVVTKKIKSIISSAPFPLLPRPVFLFVLCLPLLASNLSMCCTNPLRFRSFPLSWCARYTTLVTVADCLISILIRVCRLSAFASEDYGRCDVLTPPLLFFFLSSLLSIASLHILLISAVLCFWVGLSLIFDLWQSFRGYFWMGLFRGLVLSNLPNTLSWAQI